jgi:hypothetical protein
LSENEEISDIFIVRTLLYYHDYRNTKKADSVNAGYFGDFIIHPDSIVDKEVKPETMNLVDVGLLIRLKDKFIKAYIRDNDDDFCDFNEIYLHDKFAISDKLQPYKFIRFE